jgi:hypothetical protein
MVLHILQIVGEGRVDGYESCAHAGLPGWIARIEPGQHITRRCRDQMLGPKSTYTVWMQFRHCWREHEIPDMDAAIDTNNVTGSVKPAFLVRRQSLIPFIDRKCILLSPHSVEACHDRLRQSVSPTIRWVDFGFTHSLGSNYHPIYGKVEECRFTIRAFHFGGLTFGNNLSRLDSVVANGNLVPVDDWTEIRLSLGMSRLGKIMTTPWFILGIILWPISVLVLVVDALSPPVEVGFVLFAFFMTWTLGFILLGRWRSRKRAVDLVEFLLDVLDAQIATPSRIQ